MRLTDKVILITGSCTGIGRAMAQRCAAEGARVVVHGLDEAPGRALVETLGPDRATLRLGDLTAEGMAASLVGAALEAFGRLDALVNNAAFIAASNVYTTDVAFFQRMMAVNVLAPLTLIQAALPHLEQNRGCVLNIGSVNAWCGEENLLAYSVSKGALMTLTRNLGDSLFRQSGVRVNQINPGWVLTEKERQLKQQEGFADDWPQRLSGWDAPAGRLLAPDEIAAAAVFWLSDECGPVSGQVMELEQHPLLGRNPPKRVQ